MPEIIVRDAENIEVSLKRFKKSIEREGILTEIRRRDFFEKPSVKRKRKADAAKRKMLKKQRQRNVSRGR